MTGPITKVLSRAGDGALDRPLGKLALGEDVDLVGQVVARRTERNRLVRVQALNQRHQFADMAERHPHGAAARHRAGRSVADDLVGDQLNFLGEQSAELVKNGKFNGVVRADTTCEHDRRICSRGRRRGNLVFLCRPDTH